VRQHESGTVKQNFPFPLPTPGQSNTFRATSVKAYIEFLLLQHIYAYQQSAQKLTQKHPVTHGDNFQLLICDKCRIYSVIEKNYKNWSQDDKDSLEVAKAENYELIGITPKPENIELPVNIVLQTCKDQIAAVNIAKSLCKTADEMKAKARSIIINHLARVDVWEEAPEQDRMLCLSICILFGFSITGAVASTYEQSLWPDLRSSWPKFLTIGEAGPAKKYLAAWGIHYTLKYYDLVKVISANNHDKDNLFKICKEKLENSTLRSQVVETRKYLENHTIREAFQHYGL